MTSLVAKWLDTIETPPNALSDLACVAVVEGTACFDAYFAGCWAVALNRTAVVPILAVTPGILRELSSGHATTAWWIFFTTSESLRVI